MDESVATVRGTEEADWEGEAMGTGSEEALRRESGFGPSVELKADKAVGGGGREGRARGGGITLEDEDGAMV